MIAVKFFFSLWCIAAIAGWVCYCEVYVTHYGAHHDDVDVMQLTAAYHIISSDL